MTYRVQVAPAALEDLAKIATDLAEQTEIAGPIWFDRLLDHIFSLDEFPARCPVSPEETDRYGMEVRCLLFGRRQHRRRILFHIDGPTVHVLHVVHGARNR